MHSYRVAGLGVASEIDLPGLIVPAPSGQPPDVTIRLGPVPSGLDGAGVVRPTYEIAGDRFLFRIRGVARFLLRAGREMTVEPEAGTPLADIAIFITGTVFGILLHQRGQAVLHASAVRVGNHAVLFCGSSGAGKSTMAAVLGQGGYAALADDVCAIARDASGRPLAQADGRRLKLWTEAVDKLGLGGRRGAAVRDRLEKYYVEPPESTDEALPLGAVYVLRETRPPLRDGIERLNIVDATVQIRRNAYRPRLVQALGQGTDYFRLAALIADKAGVFVLRRPLDFTALPKVVAGLEAHWRAAVLLEAAP